MAIATTLPIRFSDVCSEIYGSPSTVGKTLLGAYVSATGAFDPLYAFEGENLQGFRGYDHLPVPVTPANLLKTASTSNSITMSWESVYYASYYKLYRSTTIGGSYVLIYSGTALTYNNTGLSSSTTYYYKVSASNISNEESPLSDATAAATDSSAVSIGISSLSTTSTNSSVSCGYGLVNTKWLISSPPEIGDVVYESSSLTTAFNGSSRYWHLGSYSARINTSGVILSLSPCF